MKFFVFIIFLTVWGTSLSEYTFSCEPPSEDSDFKHLSCSPAPDSDFSSMKGEKGDQGDFGLEGPKGDRGPYGNFGPQGPRGRKGEKGDAGPTGEKGETGLVGAPGPKGEPGEREVDLIEFEDYKQDMEERLQMLEKNLKELQSCCSRQPTIINVVPTLPPHLSDRDPKECILTYKNRCFNLTGQRDVERTWEQYVNDCERLGGTAANIYDSYHFNLTTEAIRTARLPHSTHLMLGMRFDVFKQQLLFHNGTAAHFEVPWRPQTPTRHPTHTTIQLYVRANPYAAGQGMYNRAGNHVRAFGLCEFAIKDDSESGSGDATSDTNES